MSKLAQRVGQLEESAESAARSALPFWVDWWTDPDAGPPPGALTREGYRAKYGTDPLVIFRVVREAAPVRGEDTDNGSTN